MDVRSTTSAVLALFLATSLSPLCWAQSTRSTYDPAGNGRPSKSREGFIDFTLKRINPSDKDYGHCIDQGRKLLLTETIENGYFWSNVVSLGLLGCLFILVIYQQKHLNRAEWKSAEILAQYEHALARSHGQVEDANKRNQGFMQSLSELKESALRAPGLPTDAPDVNGSPTRPRTSTGLKKTTAPPTNGNAKAVVATEPANEPAKAVTSAQIALFNRDGDLVMKLNSQEQQITAMREQMNLLRRQLTESERKVRAEQEKNRSLKGE
jgi:hypothetical protein